MTRHRYTIATALVAGTLGGVALVAPAQVSAQGDADQELADRHAPVVMVKAQDGECDTDGEAFAPMDVDHLLGDRDVALRQLSRENPVVMRAPEAADLAGLGPGYFLDMAGDSVTPGCVYEQLFRRLTDGEPPVVYAHVVVDAEGETPRVYLQYWLYWLYNDWNNRHESDWEGITVVFEADSVEAALAVEPVAVAYSQHEGGERADWNSDKLERDGDRPVVYSSVGSHASYFGSAVYLGRGASEGFGCDDTTGPSNRLDPEVVVLPDTADGDDPLAWLTYEGRWGERQNGAFNGPTGPTAKDRWLDPAPWFDDLRDSSVVIPAASGVSASVISIFCGAVEGGSTTLVAFAGAPEVLIVLLALLGYSVSALARRTDWTAVAASPLVARRRLGQIIRCAWVALRSRPATFMLFGVLAVPVAIVTALVASVARSLPVVGPLVGLLGSGRGTSLLVALLIGSTANVVTWGAVSALVSTELSGATSGVAPALEAVRRSWRNLLSAYLRAFAVVGLLVVSVVGLPWAIRQSVRYQFIAQAVMLEGAAGRDAPARSSALTAGRWWHTAAAAVIVHGLGAVTASGVGLLLLLGASSAPLWLFSGLMTMVTAVTTPVAAIAITLLYGDARAERAGDPSGDRDVLEVGS